MMMKLPGYTNIVLLAISSKALRISSKAAGMTTLILRNIFSKIYWLNNEKLLLFWNSSKSFNYCKNRITRLQDFPRVFKNSFLFC